MYRKTLAVMSVHESLPPEDRSGNMSDIDFETGEVYLFHRHDAHCPAAGSLWGIFDRRYGSRIGLESSTEDQFHFRHWHLLDPSYRYCRRSTRAEMRDYVANMILTEVCGETDGRSDNPLRRAVLQHGALDADEDASGVVGAVASELAGAGDEVLKGGPERVRNEKSPDVRSADGADVREPVMQRG